MGAAARALSAAVAAAAIALPAVAAADECWVEHKHGPYPICFDPGNRLRLDATTDGLGGAIQLRHVVPGDDPDVTWRLEHDLLDVRATRDLVRGIAYAGRYVRHSSDGHVVLPFGRPRKLFLPFDLGAEAQVGRLVATSSGDTLLIGAVRTAALLELSRADHFRHRIAIGPAARWDVVVDRESRSAREHTVAPFSLAALDLRFESRNGLTIAGLRAEAGGEWSNRVRMAATTRRRGRDRARVACGSGPSALDLRERRLRTHRRISVGTGRASHRAGGANTTRSSAVSTRNFNSPAVPDPGRARVGHTAGAPKPDPKDDQEMFMTRLSRAVALTAVTLALPLGAMACNKEEKSAGAPEAKTGDTPAAELTAPSAGTDPSAAAAKPTTPPPGQAATPPGQPPGMPAMPAQPVKKPDSVKPSHVAVADKIVAAANKFGDDLAATKGDCKKATGVLKTGGGPLKAVMAETDKLQQELKGDQAAMQWFQQTYGPKMMSGLQKVGAVLQQCSSDKEFAATFESLGLGGRPRRPPPQQPTPGESHGALPPAAMAAPPAQPKKEADPKK